jgi:hypothetical protein
MNENLLNLVVENSIKEKTTELVLETGTTTSDVSATDRIVGNLIREVFPASLAGQVCSIQPLTGPEGHIIAIGRKRDVNGDVIKGTGSGIETRRTFVSAVDHKIETDFTIEFIQDLVSQFGDNAYTLLTDWLKNTLIEDMNDELILAIKAVAVDAGNLIPQTSSDFDGGTHSIIYRAQKLYGDILSKTNRFFNPFVICTPSIGMMLTLGSDAVEKTSLKNYLGTVANIQIYEATSPKDGTQKIFVNNRYVLTKNPADRDTTGTNSDFFAKFTVDLSAF